MNKTYIILLLAGLILMALSYGKAFPCEGLDLASGKIVIGDSIEEVLENLERKEV